MQADGSHRLAAGRLHAGAGLRKPLSPTPVPAAHKAGSLRSILWRIHLVEKAVGLLDHVRVDGLRIRFADPFPVRAHAAGMEYAVQRDGQKQFVLLGAHVTQVRHLAGRRYDVGAVAGETARVV